VRKRFSVEQIVAVLKQAEAGAALAAQRTLRGPPRRLREDSALSGHGPVKTFSTFTEVTFRPSSSLICALQSCLVSAPFSPCFRP
jgi:hypothetical protein